MNRRDSSQSTPLHVIGALPGGETAQSFSHWPSWPDPFGLKLAVTPAHPCPYLDGRGMSTRGFMCDDVPPAAYRMLLDTGFRRSGRVFYQPVCRGCRACVPLRVVVGRFEPTRSQRRAAKRNSDLTVTEHAPAPSDEKYDLYRRYLAQRHDGQQSDSYGDFVSFLCDSPTRTVEFQYRDGEGKLLGVGICDLMPGAISTAYFYFDPDARRRSIGVFSVLHEIDFARRSNCDYYYLGYWVAGSTTMDYKARYRPCQILCTDGVWRDMD